MNKTRPVLVLAGTPRVVQAVARSLHRHGVIVDVAYWGASGPLQFASRVVRQLHRLPDFRQNDFWCALDKLIEQHQYDMLVPTTDEALLAILPFYERLRERLYPGCPAPQIVATVLDKRVTICAAGEIGINVPGEYRFADLAELEARRSEIAFPLLAKPASKAEEFNFDLKRFDSFEQLRHAFAAQPAFLSRYLLQEYCLGHGVGVEILIWNGEIQAAFQHRRVKELPASGGVSVLAEAQAVDPRLLDASARLLRKLNWQGVAMVEFRYDPATSKAVLMEINGRYWGSLPLSILSGSEFPFYEWQAVHRITRCNSATYRPGARVLWRTGDLMRFIGLVSQWRSGRLAFGQIEREFAGVLRDLVSFTPDAIWDWKDPAPAIRELYARIISQAVKKSLPRGFRTHLAAYRYCGLRHGLLYSYLKLLYTLGLRGGGLLPAIRGAKSFVFVCSGNIMRSPFAAALLRQHCDGKEVRSAGLFASPGQRADPFAIDAAREAGVFLCGHSAKELSAETVNQSDVILVMDHMNEAVLINRFPSAARKTFLLGALYSNGKPKEIADPHGRGLEAVRECYGEVRQSVNKIIEVFQGEPSRAGGD